MLCSFALYRLRAYTTYTFAQKLILRFYSKYYLINISVGRPFFADATDYATGKPTRYAVYMSLIFCQPPHLLSVSGAPRRNESPYPTLWLRTWVHDAVSLFSMIQNRQKVWGSSAQLRRFWTRRSAFPIHHERLQYVHSTHGLYFYRTFIPLE